VVSDLRGKVFAGYRNKLWQREEMDGIQIIRVWSYITRNEGFAKRVLDYVSYMITASVAALFVRRVDIIVGTSPQFFTACAANIVSVLKRRPWVFELRDIWPESIRAVNAMKRSRVLDWLEKLELFLYRKVAAVVSVTQSFRQNLIERGIEGRKIHVITNGVDTSRFRPIARDTELEEKLGLEGKFVAGYIGTHGLAHGLDTLLEAATILKKDPGSRDIHILFLGDGAKKSALMDRARRENLNNVIFLDSVEKDEVTRYWSLLDVAIIHLKKNDLFKTVIPSKLFECMGMGIPVLHGVEGESADIVEKYQVGVTSEPENAEMLSAKLLKLQNDGELLKRLASNGAAAARIYDRAKLAGEMLALLEQVNCEHTASANKP